MKNNKLKLKLSHYRKKLEELENLFGRKELKVSYDVLDKEKKTNYELLYFDCENNGKN